MAARHSHRGFTLLETMVVLAIAIALATLAVLGLQRAKPRASLATASTDLQALFRNARLNAMSTGRNSIVMVFPNFANPLGGTGRVIVLEDPDATFFRSTAAINFESYDPSTHAVGADTEMLLSLDLPRGVEFGGSMGALPAPYTRIDTSFTATAGSRGAVQYDSRGRATFHTSNGAPLDLWGVALPMRVRMIAESGTGGLLDKGAVGAVRALILTSTTGSVRLHSGS